MPKIKPEILRQIEENEQINADLKPVAKLQMNQSKYSHRERSSRLTKLIERHTGSKNKPEKENNLQVS
jgi:hypothetical protein